MPPETSVWEQRIKYPVKITLTYRCCVPNCGEEMVNESETHLRFMIAPPQMPEGWRECWGALVCPKHKVHMRVDNGVEFDLP